VFLEGHLGLGDGKKRVREGDAVITEGSYSVRVGKSVEKKQATLTMEKDADVVCQC